jgi:ribosome-binding factor A
MANKYEKLQELLRELAAQFFSRKSNRQSLITVTSVEVLSRGGRAIIRVTVLPENQEEAAVEFMSRRLTDFREFVRINSRIGRIPFFDVEIDIGEKNRQRIEEITGKIQEE